MVSRSPRHQLAINCPAELLERLRREAAARGTTATLLVIEALEAHLGSTAAKPDLGARLDTIESRLDAIERHRPAPHPPVGGAPIPRSSEPMPTRMGDAEAAQPTMGNPPDDAITGARLAQLLGLRSASAINAWAGRHSPGETYRGWELLGKVRPDGGGPARWVFRPSEGAERDALEQTRLGGI